MSGQENSDNVETLFSFELLVEYIRIEKGSKVSDELAFGLRLLDFPTLLIYQPQQSSADANNQQHDGNEKQGEHAFNRGKSCFFKMNLNSLHTHLSNTPLYAMVLDVKEEIPKLVGTSLISLGKAMDRIRQDVTDHGDSTPSSHGERGVVAICNLTGEKIGSISLSYKLLSLGASLLPRITESRVLESTGVPRGQQSIMEKNIPESLLLDCRNSDVSRHMQNKKPSYENSLINDEKQDDGVAIQSEHKPRSQMPQESEKNTFDEDLTLFCPPHLFYKNSAEEQLKNKGVDCRLLNRDSDAFTFEDTEEETSGNEIEATASPMMNERVKTSRNQETSVTPNVLGDALRQLPLLNALLVELSQLNNQNPNQPWAIHPHLSWIYRPASAEPSAGRGNTPRKAQAKSLQKTRQGTSPNLKLLHSPRNCSTPVARPAKDRQEEALIESKNSSKSPRQKLVYGTTKTFNLRLKQISPLKIKRRECMDLLQNQSSMIKEKTKSSHKIIKSKRRKSELFNPSSRIHENVETVMQSITADSAQQETITLKQRTLHGMVHGKQDRDSPRIVEKPSISERDLKCIHIPSVAGDSVSQNKDEKQHHSELNQVKSQSESDRRREKIESSASSSPKSSFSDSSGEENEEADYADDFNSLEPSDAYSPDPMSSPEPSRAKTPRSPVRLDLSISDSEGFHKRAALPVPIKAPSSPLRSLRGTHIIRPRTHASALSFSSEDGDRDGSLQTIYSRKQMTGSSRVDRSSGAESLISSRGQRSGSNKNSGPVRGLSVESISSFEPQEVEELEDELGSLDFKKEYQHISELVANKLPGYTM